MIILPLRNGVRLEREFHVARAARERYQANPEKYRRPERAERTAARVPEGPVSGHGGEQTGGP